jgi:uncharacterized protein YegP (UPF0339 family)
MRFEIFKDHKAEWRWRLRSTNGNVIADSAESYARRQDCERGIEIVKGSATAPVVDMSAKIAEGGTG